MSTHEAGRELDALIANKVMGQFAYPNRIPRFSTNIAAAWLIVARLIAKGWGFDLRNHGTWTAVLDYRDERHATEDGDTAPLAICRAVLEAHQ